MKKTLLILVSMASVFWTAHASETLYHTTFNTAEEVQGWTVIDNNHDGCKWGFSETGDEGKRFYYSYSGTNQADDWAVSPAITPDADCKLLVRYSFTGSMYREAMKVYFGTSETISGLSQNLVADYPDIDSSLHSGYFVVNAVANQPVHIGFYAYTAADCFRLYLNELTITELDGDPVDLALSAVTAPLSGENLTKEAVKVLIKNVGESEVDKFDVSYSVDDGEKVTETVTHTLAKGEEYEYTFNTLADLSTTRKSYTITATVEHSDDIDTSNNSASTQIRNYANATEPYAMGFESSEDTSRIKLFNENKDNGDWDIAVGNFYMNLARTGNVCLAYNYDPENAADDWAILEPIQVKAGYHALKFWYSGSENHTEKLLVAYGNKQEPSAMKTTIVDLPNITQGEYQESITIFNIDKDQTIYIGFKAYSDKDENWLTIDDVSLEAIEDPSAIDMVIKNFSSIKDFVPQADYKRVTFDLYNMSINDTQATIKVFTDDALIATKTEDILAQQTRTITYEGLLDDVQVGTHTIKVTVENSADNNLDNNSVSKTARFLGTPDILYDFEDGKVPDTFQYFVNDDGTLNASAISEYGENGWTTTEIESHKLYGNYMLIGSTWVTLVNSSELDRLLVLPQVHVDADDACFAWTVGSFNTNYPVSYRVMANDGTWGDNTDKWHYDYLKSVPSQDTNFTNEGVSLSDYAGKDIYVAIHLYGTPGDAVIFDNLQFHGCSNKTNAVKNIIADNSALSISVNGDMLNIISDSAVKAVSVYDINGRIVASANSASLSISALPKGIYIVKAATANATKTVKIVK
jgi:hypothetical protein